MGQDGGENSNAMAEPAIPAKVESEAETVTPFKEKREAIFRISKVANLAAVYLAGESKTATTPPIKPHSEKATTTAEATFSAHCVIFMENSKSKPRGLNLKQFLILELIQPKGGWFGVANSAVERAYLVKGYALLYASRKVDLSTCGRHLWEGDSGVTVDCGEKHIDLTKNLDVNLIVSENV